MCILHFFSYICLKKYEDAASVLFRRSDVKTLELAMELAEKSGNEELYKAVLFRYNAYKDENGVEEKELPSKLDAVLKQHNGKKKVVEEKVDLDKECSDGKSNVEIQNEETVSLENTTIEKQILRDETSEENVAATEICKINEQE